MGAHLNNIIPECYVDTNILKTLLCVKGVNHQYGCNQVMSKLSKGKFADSFAIGVIDDDKKKTYNCEDFQELCRSEHLVLMKHKSKHHYLFFVYKAAEDFLLACAHELGLNMADYNLPDSLKELKEVTKSNDSDQEPRIKSLVNALRTSSEMSRLSRSIVYLQEKKYDANIDELIELFK